MLKKILLSSVFFVFFVLTASAQSNSCDLQLNVFDSSNTEKIENAKLTFVNFASFKQIKARSKRGTKTVTDLKKGIYRIKVEKKGFKTSFKRIFLDCEKDLFTENLFLKSGNSKENLFILDDDHNLTASGEIFFDDDINIIGISMPRPAYPKKCSSDCEVEVLIIIDGTGNVVSTKAVSGQQYLHEVTEQAARNSKFLPVVYKGTPVKVKGVMKYIFN